MAMFFGAPYDTGPSSIYVFTRTAILKLKYIVVNNILFCNILVHDIGIP